MINESVSRVVKAHRHIRAKDSNTFLGLIREESHIWVERSVRMITKKNTRFFYTNYSKENEKHKILIRDRNDRRILGALTVAMPNSDGFLHTHLSNLTEDTETDRVMDVRATNIAGTADLLIHFVER